MRAFFMTENRQFRHFIIFTMILIDTHDSAVRGEERLCRTDAIPRVAAVATHRLTQQTGRDPETDAVVDRPS
jgi:hypothetical protein